MKIYKKYEAKVARGRRERELSERRRKKRMKEKNRPWIVVSLMLTRRSLHRLFLQD